MGEAYECDRCGGLREGSPAYSLTVATGYPRDRPQDRDPVYTERMDPAPVDLCPACHNDLRNWYGNAGGDRDDVDPVAEDE